MFAHALLTLLLQTGSANLAAPHMVEVSTVVAKRKRRKKVPFQAGGEQPQGSGSKPPPLVQEEPEDSPYGLYDPDKSLQDLIVPKLAE